MSRNSNTDKLCLSVPPCYQFKFIFYEHLEYTNRFSVVFLCHLVIYSSSHFNGKVSLCRFMNFKVVAERRASSFSIEKQYTEYRISNKEYSRDTVLRVPAIFLVLRFVFSLNKSPNA